MKSILLSRSRRAADWPAAAGGNISGARRFANNFENLIDL
jgi:hypothetical protein